MISINFSFTVVLLVFVTMITGQAQSKMLRINEIMIKPINFGDLPNFEYIELLNTGSKSIDLSKVSIRIGFGSTQTPLPSYQLAPSQYVLICSEQALASLEPYGNVFALTKWTSLNNTGTTITLHEDELILDRVTYTDKWYKNASKSAGGWSLERINPNFSCNLMDNWAASESPSGGTPCKPNSIYNSSAVPTLLITSAKLHRDKIHITFNIPATFLDHVDPNLFEIDQQIGAPENIEWNASRDTITLYYPQGFAENQIYNLQIKPFLWCSQTADQKYIALFLQGNLGYNDIIINEILFNPKQGGADFVELYNNSNAAVNLQNWKLGNRNISATTLILQPQGYAVFTTNKSVTLKHYLHAAAHNIFEIPSLPPYTNERGNVVLYAPHLLMDSLYYTAQMHQPFLVNAKGVSLERQRPNSATNATGNFRSASSLAGSATPGYANSTNVDNFFKKNSVTLSSKTMSPNADNFEDQLEINYEFIEGNYQINLLIYDDKGREINRLIRNQSAGNNGKIIWDGRKENGQISPSGFYMYQLEIYNNTGFYQRFKGSFVVILKSVNN